MPLTPPNEGDPERILLTGPSGAGKSWSWLNIARWSQRTGSSARFWALDTDKSGSTRRLLHTEYKELTNVQHRRALDWEALRDGIKEYLGQVSAGDWIVVDMLGPQSWDFVQEWYTKSVFQRGKAEYFLQVRMAMESGGKKKDGQGLSAFEGFSDWPVIKGEYQECLTDLFIRSEDAGVHLLATAGIDQLGKKEDRETMTVFGPHGVKPQGEKSTNHMFHTVLWVSAPMPGTVNMTTLKDRGRPVMYAETFQEFALSYLKGVAGWSL